MPDLLRCMSQHLAASTSRASIGLLLLDTSPSLWLKEHIGLRQ
jgi:hypothetical protein